MGIVALVVTLVVAVVTGLFTGAVLKLQCFSQGLFGEAHLFEDKVNWELEEGAADAGAMEMARSRAPLTSPPRAARPPSPAKGRRRGQRKGPAAAAYVFPST